MSYRSVRNGFFLAPRAPLRSPRVHIALALSHTHTHTINRSIVTRRARARGVGQSLSALVRTTQARNPAIALLEHSWHTCCAPKHCPAPLPRLVCINMMQMDHASYLPTHARARSSLAPGFCRISGADWAGGLRPRADFDKGARRRAGGARRLQWDNKDRLKQTSPPERHVGDPR